jgi:hypothetical protein
MLKQKGIRYLMNLTCHLQSARYQSARHLQAIMIRFPAVNVFVNAWFAILSMMASTEAGTLDRCKGECQPAIISYSRRRWNICLGQSLFATSDEASVEHANKNLSMCRITCALDCSKQPLTSFAARTPTPRVGPCLLPAWLALRP